MLFAGLTVAISVTGLAFIGLDFVTKLGIGSALGVLTTVLIANSLLLAVLALLGHKVDRLKVPFLRADRRLRGGAREDARRTLGPLRDPERADRLPGRARADRWRSRATSALVRLGAADQGTQPKEQTSRRAYDLLAEGFGPGFNGPIPIVVDVNGDAQAPQRIFDGVAGPSGRGVRGRAAAQRREDGRRSSS